MEYRPDKWQIIKITNGPKVFYKILAEWSGGYTHGKSWRMSSAIESVDDSHRNYFSIKNMSGSTYLCGRNSNGLGLLTSGIFNRLKEDAELDVIEIEELMGVLKVN